MPTLQWGLLLCDPTVVLIPHPPPTLCPVAVRTSSCLCGTGGAALSCSAACRTTTVGLGGELIRRAFCTHGVNAISASS